MKYIFRGLVNSKIWGADQVMPDDGKWAYGDLQLHGDMTRVDGRLVDPRTIGIDTGLRDINDKHIFEGDIVVVDGNTIAQIVWHEYLCQFYLCFCRDIVQHKNDSKASLGEMFYQYCHTFEVIGNVYEDIDLLPQQNPYLIVKGS